MEQCSRTGKKGGEVTLAADGRRAGGATVEPDEASDISRLTELVALGAIERARELAARLGRERPDSEQVKHWMRVLAPPVVTSRPAQRSRSFGDEHCWLRAHAHEYPGCWLAVLGDRLLAADPDPRQVVARTRGIEGADGALLHYQPGPAE